LLGLSNREQLIELLYSCAKQNTVRAITIVNELYEKNGDISACFFELLSICRDTLVVKNVASPLRFLNVSDAENFAALKSRVKYVLDIAKENEVDILILGAWGCGVFGQDPADVANLLKHYLTTTHKCFKTVVFAVPKGNNANYSEFKKVFCS
jgi:hypothetical protein